MSSSPTIPPLGEPLTPTTERALNGPPQESKVIAEFAPPQQETTYRVGSVLALIGAICISHFLLVIGGFTGERGFGKLEAAQAWFKGAFSG